MGKVRVIAKRDFIETLASAKPVTALSELIWNGFDADADRVKVFIELNEMDGVESVKVRDNGYGIDHDNIEAYFGGLGDSWKKQQGKQKGRALHGKNGRGRFKAFALGERVQWNTVYKTKGKTYAYQIVGHAASIEDFDTTDLEGGDATRETGTEVVIENVARDFRSFRDGSVQIDLAKSFAAYLTEYPHLTLEFDGDRIDPEDVQQGRAEYNLGDVQLSNGSLVSVAVTVVEWKMQTERMLHLCDAKGIALHEVPVGQQVRAPGFNFTVYVKSDLFRELDKLNLLLLSDLHPDVQHVLKVAKGKVKEHFRRRLAEHQSEIVQKWKSEKIYPYEDKTEVDPVESVERQVFDILAVNVQSYLPSFEDADQTSRKFTFRLLAQAIRQNPDSVQTIIGEVLGLKKDAQDELAALLKKTSLSSIISSAKIVANRLDFLSGLEALVFDEETKDVLLERDQLHKILENESWLFHEEFGLAGSEQRLEEVLQKHLAKLGEREEPITDPVDVGNGRRGRIDLMLQKAIQPRAGTYEYLVVELKRPSKKINDEVITQIEKYAIAVANDERFRGVPAKWTFVAISNDLDDFAKRKANQRDRPKGQIFDDAELNVTVWVRSWADVINDARAKLRFINQQLSYEANRDTATAYLHKTHAKFIPDVTDIVDDEGPSLDE
ncbi:MAG: ATP-binding protein [Rhodocyclaceae bacterium]|nr:ATP-binding protein [Rhodocyclaceae bacterium]